MHVKAIGIGVESSFVIEADAAEFHDDFMSAIWGIWKAEKIYVHLEIDLVVSVLVESYCDVGFM